MGGEFIVGPAHEQGHRHLQKSTSQPIMGLGNSTSDSAVLEFVMDEPAAHHEPVVLADDTEREWGNPDKAETLRAMCEEKGWTPVSTANEWVTITARTWQGPDWGGRRGRPRRHGLASASCQRSYARTAPCRSSGVACSILTACRRRGSPPRMRCGIQRLAGAGGHHRHRTLRKGTVGEHHALVAWSP